MSRVLLVGAGAVGGRAARQLVETPGLEHLLVSDRRRSRAEQLAGAVGAEVIEWRASEPLPDDVDAVGVAVPSEAAFGVVARCREAAVPVATSADVSDDVELFLEEGPGRAPAVAIGCGLAPGLACVLARHAADLFDTVDDVSVARVGSAGAASGDAARRERRRPAREWRAGRWETVKGAGPELVWFPDPIGARECVPVTGVASTLARAFPGAAVRARLGESTSRRFERRDPAGEWGAVRVEVNGRRGGVCETVVYGVIDRTAIAAGAVLAVATAGVAGLLDVMARSGAGGLAELAAPVPFLSELARRGVKTAVFEGVAV